MAIASTVGPVAAVRIFSAAFCSVPPPPIPVAAASSEVKLTHPSVPSGQATPTCRRAFAPTPSAVRVVPKMIAAFAAPKPGSPPGGEIVWTPVATAQATSALRMANDTP